MIRLEIFFYVTIFVLPFVVWRKFVTISNLSIENENFMEEEIQYITDEPKIASLFQTTQFSEDLKYMLIWNQRNLAPLNNDYFKDGQKSFILKKCPIKNCYVTSDRNYFGGDVTKFDAIGFNGRNVTNLANDLPKERSPHQKYIYFNMESADNLPVCHSAFDNFFNWTATYKLDSDIPFPYILIRKDGKIVGPDVKMNWPAEFPDISDKQEKFNKRKAAAWFVSRCHSNSKREDIASELQKALSDYGYSIDIYGACGPLECLRNNKACDEMLETDYFFYLSFENSFSEDYVTEKLLRALHHDVVPIVYGGANYSRFLPPNSYIDAKKYNASSLAMLMDQLIRTPTLYAKYFRWKPFYQYSSPQTNVNVCNVCAALNDQDMFSKTTVHKEFRKWWLGLDNFRTRC